MDKHQLRESLIKQRKELTSYKVEELSNVIISKIKKHPQFINAKTIAYYVAYKSEKEVDLKLLIDSSKKFVFPKIEGEVINFFDHKNQKIDLADIDLFLVPLVGFNDQNYRIGFGKGYYDKCLANTSAFTIGIAFDFQKTSFTPEPHDIPLNEIITDKNIYAITRTPNIKS